MVPTIWLANNFIKASFEGRIEHLTPMKLQKLLYFTYGVYAAKTNQQLFSENFEAWQYGPVLSSVYHEFKSFGAEDIYRYATDAEGHAYALKLDNPNYNILQQVFNIICKKFSRISGLELSMLTHQKDTPWANSYANGIISFEDIKDYFVRHKAEYDE